MGESAGSKLAESPFILEDLIYLLQVSTGSKGGIPGSSRNPLIQEFLESLQDTLRGMMHHAAGEGPISLKELTYLLDNLTRPMYMLVNGLLSDPLPEDTTYDPV